MQGLTNRLTTVLRRGCDQHYRRSSSELYAYRAHGFTHGFEAFMAVGMEPPGDWLAAICSVVQALNQPLSLDDM